MATNQQKFLSGAGLVILAGLIGVFFHTKQPASTGQVVGAKAGGETCSQEECENADEPYECPSEPSMKGQPKSAEKNPDDDPSWAWRSCTFSCGYTAQVCVFDTDNQSSCGQTVEVTDSFTTSIGLEIGAETCGFGFSAGVSKEVGTSTTRRYTSGKCETCCKEFCFNMSVSKWECSSLNPFTDDWTVVKYGEPEDAGEDSICEKDCFTCANECCDEPSDEYEEPSDEYEDSGSEKAAFSENSSMGMEGRSSGGAMNLQASQGRAAGEELIAGTNSMTVAQVNAQFVPELLCVLQEDSHFIERIQLVATDGVIELREEDWEQASCP